ncbi:hypothetical protein [Pseudomonas fluorescens]|uniref:hypothetical protein n=1 Tax=Pseudomonas fluorescens TaxID=294 RepID=UPI00123F3F5C|nr:hypothetical protein [Pseudomonas fluorescens]
MVKKVLTNTRPRPSAIVKNPKFKAPRSSAAALETRSLGAPQASDSSPASISTLASQQPPFVKPRGRTAAQIKKDLLEESARYKDYIIKNPQTQLPDTANIRTIVEKIKNDRLLLGQQAKEGAAKTLEAISARIRYSELQLHTAAFTEIKKRMLQIRDS